MSGVEEIDRVRKGAELGKGKHSYTIKAFALVLLLRYLLIASWLSTATQLPKVAHARGSKGMLPRKILKFNWFEIAF